MLTTSQRLLPSRASARARARARLASLFPLPPLLPLLLLLAGCGGNSGPAIIDSEPTIVAAAWVGSGGTPAAGDLLILTFSERVVATGAVLDDSDVALSSGSLGAVAAAPAMVGDQSVQITLGAGVNLTPGTTTIALAPTDDAIADQSGRLGTGGAPRTIVAGDGDNPAITRLTLAGVDSELNGTGPAGGTLQVPVNGFEITLDFDDATSPVDPSLTTVSASVAVTVSGALRLAGEDLADAFVLTEAPGTATFTVPGDVFFPPGPVTVSTLVIDQTSMPSSPATFAFQTAGTDDGMRPLEAVQTWFIDLSRDLESFTSTPNGTSTRIVAVQVNPASNGRSDLEDLFLIVGLHSATPLQNVSGGKDSNEVVMDLFRARVLTELGILFPGVDVAFTYTPPATFPSGTSPAFLSFPFSQICVAGSSTFAGTLGAALFDRNNTFQDDNCQTNFQGLRLGVFLHTAIEAGYVLGGLTSLFNMTYVPLTPNLTGGVPIGNDPTDRNHLTGPTTGPRATLIDDAIGRMARLTAVVLAHECGHSMGLVMNGPMPAGLYGNDPINFPLSGPQPPSNADAHIENTSLFPAGAQNVMSPAIDFDAAQSPDTRFNTLNLAYFRQMTLYNKQ